jgi:hypothetical protein
VRKFTSGAWSDDVAGLGTIGCCFASCAIIAETDGSLSAYWLQKNTMLYGESIQNGGDIAMSHKPLGGSWSAKTILQVAAQLSGPYYNPNGPYPLDSIIAVENGLSELQVLWAENINDNAPSGQSFLPRQNVFAYGSGAYVPATRTVWTSSATAGLFAKFFPKPNAARMALIDPVLQALQTANLFASYQAFYVFAADSQNNALTSWTPPTVTSATFVRLNKATIVGSPTFTANQGFQGNGTSDYIDSGGSIVNGSQNSLSGWAYTLSASDNNMAFMGTGVLASPQLFVQHLTSTSMGGRVGAHDGL